MPQAKMTATEITVAAAKRRLEPYFLECLGEIARRAGLSSGDALLATLAADQVPATVRKVREFVICYYRAMARGEVALDGPTVH
ncbi:hypothetical protein [Azospirillum thermophilum]|uniref:Uncharacterized protein n=1 Tax=Azospirillum thermophilum TaxID=2202148 RepID=A0A2S2D0P4_9PROT|nr:hypothetical protein [Azospirillum thermophilum]AWK90329.1 hypothetical protein DEW08_30400 [Azospirillum thermophilum]